jgi:PilZ domain
MADALEAGAFVGAEQRKATRYKVRLPVLFKWSEANGVGLQGGGFTRDISTDGLFVCCDRFPPLKTVLSMEILLSFGGAPSSSLLLTGQGEVVRIEGREKQTGFATETHFDLNHGEMEPN